MPWTVTVRASARVERRRYDSLDEALSALERRAQALADGAPGEVVNVKVRRFEPSERVIARVELSGPQRFLASVHAGIDVHGDGSATAYQGQVNRKAIAPQRGESAFDALRRALPEG